MRAWLRPILDRLTAGLVPLDGDFGSREAAPQDEDPCHEVQPTLPAPRAEQSAWIPNTILFGPPL